MELSQAIRTGYYSVLYGNVFHNGQPVPIFDDFSTAEGVSYPYIILSSQNNVQRFIKRCKNYDSTIVIDIVTGSNRPIGRADSENIAEQIENIINPNGLDNVDIVSNGYRIGNTFRIADNNIVSKNDVYYVYRKLLTYSHLVSKI